MNSPLYKTTYDMTYTKNACRDSLTNQQPKLQMIWPLKPHIIQLICYLLQVVIAICTQLEVLYQGMRQSFRQVKQDVMARPIATYRITAHPNLHDINLRQGLPCALFALNICLVIMLTCGMAWIFYQAGF